jgi:6-phosphogluconolactonase
MSDQRRRPPQRCLAIFALILASLSLVASAQPGMEWVYVGTYTSPGKSKGIYVMKLDVGSGALSEPQLAAEIASPSFITIHPSRKFLYAASEGGEKQGSPVSSFAIDAGSGKLTLLNQQTSGGAGPCYVATDPAGKVALVANYMGGSFESLPIGEDGKLGAPASFIQDEGTVADPKRQGGPHGHSLNADAAGKFAFGCDLGLDKIFIFKIDPATAKLTANDPPFVTLAPRTGPRHFAFHPSGKLAYANGEIDLTVTAFTYDATRGSLSQIQTVSTLPSDFTGDKAPNSTAEVQVHPSGKFLYVSNRGHNTIAIFSIDPASGKLTPAGHQPSGGKTPRNFRPDPSGKWLLAANQDSDNVVVFKVDEKSGGLTPTGGSVNIGKPVCIKFLTP